MDLTLYAHAEEPVDIITDVRLRRRCALAVLVALQE